jgi:hypothetical protein
MSLRVLTICGSLRKGSFNATSDHIAQQPANLDRLIRRIRIGADSVAQVRPSASTEMPVA